MPRDRRAAAAHDAARRRLEALGNSLASDLTAPGEPGTETRVGSAPSAADPAAVDVSRSARSEPTGRHAARPSHEPPTISARADDERQRLSGGRGDRGDRGPGWRDADGQPADRERDRPGHRLSLRLGDRVPLTVRSAFCGRFGAHHLAVLVLVLAAALCLAAWWALSARPEVQAVPGTVTPPSTVPAPPSPSIAAAPIATPPIPPTAPAATPTTPVAGQPHPGLPPLAPASDAAAEQLLVVDVAGKVRRPGIVILPWGSRVADALEAAGGVQPRVDLVTLNLARMLVDGEQLLVGIEAATVPGPGTWPDPTVVPQPVATPGAPAVLVNLNTATLADLDTLPGVGPVTAEAILTWRTENGAFSTVDELLEVSGIGDVTLGELRDLVTV